MSPRFLVSDSAARAFIEGSRFHWHQMMQLSPGVYSPGQSDIGWLYERSGLPPDLTGRSVVDIGTTNGGGAFLAERLGAGRVLAVDVMPPDHFGFGEIKSLLSSEVEFLQASVYDLPAILDERFDVVLFWGVLYHLRHPLLALDALGELCRKAADDPTRRTLVSIETAVCDRSLSRLGEEQLVRFLPRSELGSDDSNWFEPSVAALREWIRSAGFEVTNVDAWPAQGPERALISACPPLRAEVKRAGGETEGARPGSASDAAGGTIGDGEVESLSTLALLEARDAALAGVQGVLASREAEVAALERRLDAREQELAALQRLAASLEATDREGDALGAHDEAAEDLSALSAARDEILATTQSVLAARDHEIASFKTYLDAREREIASFEVLLGARERELAALRPLHQARERELEATRHVLKDRNEKLAALIAEMPRARRVLAEGGTTRRWSLGALLARLRRRLALLVSK